MKARRSLLATTQKVALLMATLAVSAFVSPARSYASKGVQLRHGSLYVEGSSFAIKGVCWNPVRKGAAHPEGLIYLNPSPEDLALIATDLRLMKEAGVNTVRTYEVITNPQVLALLADSGIRVIVPIFNYYRKTSDEVRRQVLLLREHPSTLMWEIGNEWNYNNFYNPQGHFWDSLDKVKAFSHFVKSLDSKHPVSTSHGELPSPDTVARLPEIDIWGFNIYSGLSFGDRFARWASISAKPLYIAEYGADAIDARHGPHINLHEQARAVEALSQEIAFHQRLQFKRSQVLGGSVFEWNDEWWKVPGKPYDRHDFGGIAPGGGPHPDRVFNEEWWGLVDIQRHKRPAYEALARVYRSALR